MKKFILAITATATLTALPAATRAEPALAVKIGGDAAFEGGYVTQDRHADQRASEFRNRFRLNVIPAAKADNGLEYGARLRLLAENGDRSVSTDRAFLYLRGSFGELDFGSLNGPSDDVAVVAPADWGTSGHDGSISAYLGPTGAFAPVTVVNPRTLYSADVGTRVSYSSPRFSGFQVNATYQPVLGNAQNSVERRKSAPSDGFRAGGYSDLYEVGMNYAGMIGEVTLAASAYYQGGQARPASGAAAVGFDNLSSYHLGLKASYRGLAIGGSYGSAGDSGYARPSGNPPGNPVVRGREAQTILTVGAQYTFGQTTVGGSFMRAEDAGDLAVAGANRFDLYSVGARYVVTPGLWVGPEYNRFRYKSDVASRSDQGNVVFLRTELSF